MLLLIVLIALAVLASVIAVAIVFADVAMNVIEKIYGNLKDWQVGLLNWGLMSLGWFLIVVFFVVVNQ